MIDPAARLQAQDRFRVRQHFTAVVDRYEIRTWDDSGGAGDLLAVALQTPPTVRGQVTFYACEDRTAPVFGFKARAAMNVHAVTDVVDAAGSPIGVFSKEFTTSFGGATWQVEQPGMPVLVGRERSAVVAFIRRLMLEFLPYRMDFVTPEGRRVLTVEKPAAFVRDGYDVVVHDPGLDRRVAAAIAVALEAPQGR